MKSFGSREGKTNVSIKVFTLLAGEKKVDVFFLGEEEKSRESKSLLLYEIFYAFLDYGELFDDEV